MYNKIRKNFVSVVPFIFVAILIFAVWYFEIFILNRPYWIATTDVEMDFLFRSLAIAKGYFFKHGFGLFVDFLGGAVIYLMNFSIYTVELFLKVAYFVGLLFSISGILFIQKKAFKELSLLLFIVALLFFFINPSVRMYMGYWSAEMFVSFFGILAVYYFLNSLKKSSGKNLFWSGIFGGLAMAIKPYFIPFVFASGIGYLKIWWMQSTGKKTIKTFLLFVFPYLVGFFISLMVGFLPFINGLKVIAWAMFYGVREFSIVDIMVNNLQVFIFSDPIWLLLTAAIFIILLAAILKIRHKTDIYSYDKIFLAVMAIAIFLTFLLTFVKGGGGVLTVNSGVALRFLMPVAIYELFATACFFKCFQKKITGSLKIFLLLGLTIVLFFELRGDFINISTAKMQKAVIDREVTSQTVDFSRKFGYEPKILFWGDIARPQPVLAGGNIYVKGLFSKDMAVLYPNESYKHSSIPLEQEDLRNFDMVIYLKNVSFKKDEAIIREAGFSIIESDYLIFIRKT